MSLSIVICYRDEVLFDHAYSKHTTCF